MIEILTILGFIFTAGFIASIFSRSLNLPLIPFLILSGAFISSFITLEELSEILTIGLLFLIFYIGLRTDLEGFKTVSADSLSISLIQVLVVFSAGFSIFYSFFSLTIYESLYLGITSALASTLAGTDFFEENLRTDLHHGRISTGVNLIQDIIGIIIISVIGASSISQGIDIMILTLALLASGFLFRELISSSLQKIVRTQELRLLLLVSFLGISILIGTTTDVSIIASCFIGGLALSKGIETEDFLDSFESIKDFFSVIAFVSLGLLVSLPNQETLLIALTLLSLVILLRAITIFATMLLDNHSSHTAFKTTGNLLQTSEFALAAALIAFTEGLIANNILDAIILTTSISIIFVSLITKYNDALFEKIAKPIRLTQKIDEQSQKINLKNHIILAGFDTRGQKVAQTLEKLGEDFVIIDYNKEKINLAEQKDYKTVFADLLNPKTWERANLNNSKLVICTSTHKPLIRHIAKLDKDSLILTESESLKKDLSYIEKAEILLESELIEKRLKSKINRLDTP